MRQDTINDIFDFVQQYSGATKNELTSQIKTRRLVFGRMIFAVILRKRGYSTPHIGELLNRDHTTVINLLQKAEKDPDVQEISSAMKDEKDKSLTGIVAEKILGKYAPIYEVYHGKCAVCSFDEFVEVHHIVPRRMGGGDHPSNLILLCPNHHALVDRGQLAIRDIHIKNLLSPEHTP
jgi:5-methylcytosine-specific restriction endonuclease McrA